MKLLLTCCLVFSLIMPYSAFAGGDGPSPMPLPQKRCEEALNACDELIVEQDVAIVHLKQHVKQLEEKALDNTSSGSSILVVLGVFVLGLFVGNTIR